MKKPVRMKKKPGHTTHRVGKKPLKVVPGDKPRNPWKKSKKRK
jgi:hypothetical protein